MTTTEKIIIAIISALVAVTIVKNVKAEILPVPPITNPGQIISTETNIIGDCTVDNCNINKSLLVYSTFKNIGESTVTNTVAILIDNNPVKTETITLNPNQEYYLLYNTILDTEKLYNMCGVIIE